MNLFKKNNDDVLYKAGYADAERKLILEWRQKLIEIENEKDEIIEVKELEIASLNIQLKNWKDDYKKTQEDKIYVRKEKSSIRREWNKINKFKEEIKDKLQAQLNENAGKFQEVLSLLGDYEQIENKNDRT